MQSPILKFRESHIISEKPGCVKNLSEKWNNLTSSNYRRV